MIKFHRKKLIFTEFVGLFLSFFVRLLREMLPKIIQITYDVLRIFSGDVRCWPNSKVRSGSHGKRASFSLLRKGCRTCVFVKNFECKNSLDTLIEGVEFSDFHN